MFTNFINTWKPENYHGFGKKRNFFEGWYYKLITKNRDFSLAIIPGISYSKNGKNSHSFIQFYNGKKLKADYFYYDVQDFLCSKKIFELKIKNSIFKKDYLKLDINDKQNSISGELFFENLNGWPISFLSPNIMGCYGLLGFMECYYHVLSFKNEIKGFLYINGEKIDFNNGYGYIEKNWGKSFPSAWVWLQANQFENYPDSGFMFSVARIPFLNMKFNGFVGGLFYKATLYPFATYNGANIKELDIQENSVKIQIISKKYILNIKAERKDGFYLPYPTNSGMNGKISESLNSTIFVEIIERENNNILFKDKSIFSGLEISDRAKNELIF